MILLTSIRNSLAPIHREGYPFIGIFFVVSLLLGWLWHPLFWVGMILTAWCAYFFRDPERVTPLDSRAVISPADGKISWAGMCTPPENIGLGLSECLRVSIFMNVFSVHVNRMPVQGIVKEIEYRSGNFANAELDKASVDNERNKIVVETPYGCVTVVQIAGLVARRILCWIKKEDRVSAGERFGLIRFGSRLDVYLPATAQLRVCVGQTAIAGETILATFEEKKRSTSSGVVPADL